MKGVRDMKIATFILFFLFLANFAFGQSAEIHKAAYNGDINKVRELLQKGVKPDERDSFGGTALHAAMFQKNMEIVKLLLQHHFDINAQGTQNGYTPLHDAVWANNMEAIKLLLDEGAKTNLKGRDGLTPYGKAKKEGKTEIVKYFESRGIKE
jgi:ankyrin repeat protein